MNKQFWNDTLSQIDEKFTDEAAEHIAVSSDNYADEQESVTAEPINIQPRKRSYKGLIAGLAAAAAVAGVVTVLALNRGGFIETSSQASESMGSLDSVDSEDSEDSRESSEITESTVTNGFAENVLNRENYKMDNDIFSMDFSGCWSNGEVEESLGWSEDYIFSLFTKRIGGFMSDENGKYMIGEMYGDESGDFELWYIPAENPETVYYYQNPKTADISRPDAVYERKIPFYETPPEIADTMGCAGIQMFCAVHGIDISLFDSIETECDGAVYRSIGIPNVASRVWGVSYFENTVRYIAQLTSTDSGEEVEYKFFDITLEKDGEGNWSFAGASMVDLPGNAVLPDPTDRGYDYDILQQYFFGIWNSTAESNRRESLEISFSEDCFVSGFSHSSSVFEDNLGYYMAAVNNGIGEMYFIPRSNTDLMYKFSELYPDMLYCESQTIYRRTAMPTGTLYGGFSKLSTLGLRYISEDVFGGMDYNSCIPATIYDANGEEWTYYYAPSYILGNSGYIQGNDGSNFVVAGYIPSDIAVDYDPLSENNLMKLFTLEFDSKTHEFLRSYDWDGTVEGFSNPTDITLRATELAQELFPGETYTDQYKLMTSANCRYIISEGGSCYVLREVTVAGGQGAYGYDIFCNNNDGLGFTHVYSTTERLTLEYVYNGYAYCTLNRDTILCLDSAGEVGRYVLPDYPKNEVRWEDDYAVINGEAISLDKIRLSQADEEVVTDIPLDDYSPSDDYIKLDGAIWYSAKAPELSWIYELGYTADDLGDKAGTISGITEGLPNENTPELSASALSVGTELYFMNDRRDIVAVKYGEALDFYYKWVEG